MPVAIHAIETASPPFAYAETELAARLREWVPEPSLRALLDRVHARSGIQRRHSALPDFGPGGGELFRTGPDGRVAAPGTAARNRAYAAAARPLAAEAGRRALAASGFRPDQVTHVVFATCTGFANPGPDYHLVRDLGLPEATERTTVGFMGCYAALPALRLARQACLADPTAVALVVCLELCTLHMQPEATPESIVANALFADGAAAAVVSARPPSPGRAHYILGDFRSALLPSGEAHMAWEIGDHGFRMMLSAYVPELIGANIRAIVDGLLAPRGIGIPAIDEWAVHPGGRAILDEVGRQLDLPAGALDAARGVLRDHGNMSSPTVLYVLRRLLGQGGPGRAATCALAFGPGLTVESAFLERVGAAVPAPAAVVP